MARLTCKITAVGGLRCTDRSLVGAIATPTIRQSKLDRVVIGCSALDEERDLPGCIIQKAGVSQTIIALGLGAFCGDRSKVRRRALERHASLRQVSRFSPDRPPPGQCRRNAPSAAKR